MLARLSHVRHNVRRRAFQTRTTGQLRWYSTNIANHEPLHILFCGADEFSIESLKALHDEHLFGQSNIASIDVVTRTDKRSGRGLKHLKAPPLKSVAQNLNLPLHQIDTFTGWKLPHHVGSTISHINLIIAVSFGLLVPPRILGACKFGGLNVHPSLLPDLRGAAPIQWAIMHGYDKTGVSIQTLHPSKFDEGLILDQETVPIPYPDQITFANLRDLLARSGASLLVKSIRQRLYMQERKETNPQEMTGVADSVHLARRLLAEDQLIDFATMSSMDILRRSRALSRISTGIPDRTSPGGWKRIVIGADMRLSRTEDIPAEVVEYCRGIPVGVPYGFLPTQNQSRIRGNHLLVNVRSKTTNHQDTLAIPTITISGSAPNHAMEAALKANLFHDRIESGNTTIGIFEYPLRMRLWER